MVKEKTVYVLLTDTGTVFTKMIKFFTQAPYNHVSIAFDEKLEEVYSFGRKHPRNPLNAGFIKEDVYFGTYRRFDHTRCLLLKIEVSVSEYNQIRKIVQVFTMNPNLYSYSLLGLVGVAMNYPIHIENKYFCSQFVSEVLTRSGVNLWNLPPTLVTPHDFMIHPTFEAVYEGRLYDYPKLNHEQLSIPMDSFNFPFSNYLHFVIKKLSI